MALIFPQQWTSKTNSLVDLPNIPFNSALAMTVLSRLSAVTVQTIFLVCVSMTRLLFKDLRSKIDAHFIIHVSTIKAKSRNIFDRSSLMNNTAKIESWLRYFDAVCALVEMINHCFGLILVITFCHNIIYTIRYSTLVLQMVDYSKNPNFCTVFMTSLIRGSALFATVLRMWVIFVESHRMRLEVIRYNNLRKKMSELLFLQQYSSILFKGFAYLSRSRKGYTLFSLSTVKN